MTLPGIITKTSEGEIFFHSVLLCLRTFKQFSNVSQPVNTLMYMNTMCLTLYFPMFPFDPPENIRKPLVFWCFQGDQKGTLGSKGLIFLNNNLTLPVPIPHEEKK